MAKIDDSVKKKVPELRFPGFTDDWEERKLGDEVRIVMGQSPNSENYTDDPNDYILVQGNADMKNGRVLPRVWTTQVTKQAEKDDLILSVRAPVGDIGKTAYDVVIGRGVAAIKGNEFIFQNLGKMKSDGYWTRYSTGSTFESINSTDIKEAIISVPAIEEQDKIGSFFKQLDDSIALHQCKLDLLKEQKKGYLQKMFPKNGAKVPELRFAGFADDWEQCKLSDITKRVIRKNKNLESTLPLTISAQEGLIDQNEFFNKTIASRDVSGYYLIKNGEFAYNKSYSNGYPWGAVKRLNRYNMGVLSTLYIVFKPTNIDSDFLEKYYDTTYWHKEISKHAAEGARNHGLLNIAATDFFKTELVISKSLEEQQKIGSFFKQLDDTIALHQRKLDLLKEQKKGFLQKMFV
ncbi:restriction endonuclease subunit S [Lactococcus cremoris]|uniref:restriction endonuclease subunit S n=1 Tax=Lactococcus lactis subsp. cremoris TaxID=1359 RepID=UPI003D12D9ED